MASIFDLWPASMWPVQPFIPPIDPGQPSTWPQTAGSSWGPPTSNAPSLDWPQAPAASQQPPPAPPWNLLPPPPVGQPFAPMLPAPYQLGQSFPPLDTAQAAAPNTSTGGDGGILSPYVQSMSAGDGRGILSPIMPSSHQLRPGIAATSAVASAPSVGPGPPLAPAGGLGANLLAAGAALARPVTDWWPTQGQYVRDSIDMMKQGWHDMTTMPVDAPMPDTVIGVGAVPTTSEAIRGLGEMAWGVGGYFGSPINATIHTFGGQPVENITGIPSKYTDFALGLALPFMKRLPGMGGPSFGAPRVPRAAPSPAAEAAEQAQGASRAAPDSAAAARVPPAAPSALARVLSFEEENRVILYGRNRRMLEGIDPGNPKLQTDHPPGWIPSVQDIKVLNNEVYDAGMKRELFDLDNHHGFPQGDEFRSIFNRAGINVEDYKAYMWTRGHRALDRGSNSWTREWRNFLNKYSQVNPDALHEQLNKMLKKMP